MPNNGLPVLTGGMHPKNKCIWIIGAAALDWALSKLNQLQCVESGVLSGYFRCLFSRFGINAIKSHQTQSNATPHSSPFFRFRRSIGQLVQEYRAYFSHHYIFNPCLSNCFRFIDYTKLIIAWINLSNYRILSDDLSAFWAEPIVIVLYGKMANLESSALHFSWAQISEAKRRTDTTYMNIDRNRLQLASNNNWNLLDSMRKYEVNDIITNKTPGNSLQISAWAYARHFWWQQ